MSRGRREEIQKGKIKSSRIIIIGIIIAVAVAVGVVAYFTSTTGTGQQQGVTPSTKESSPGQTILVDWKHVHGIGIDPTTIYAGTHGALYKSSGGSGWTVVGDDRSDLMGFLVHPYDGKILYSSGHPPQGGNLGFRKSIDGGLTWQTLSTVLSPPADFHAMAISAANPNILYGYDSGGRGLFRTEDGGNTWKPVNSPDDTIISLAAHPKDERVVFAGTSSGIYRSDDQGFKWSQLSEFKGFPVTALAFGREGMLYAYVASQGGGIVRSNDDGRSWITVGGDLGSETIFNIAVDPINQDSLYASGALKLQSGETAQSLYRSTNGGQSWFLIATNSKSHPAIASEPSKLATTLADITITDINGRTFSFGDFTSKILILQLTAPNCPSCAAQNSELTRLATKYTPDQVSFVSISIDPTLNDSDLKEWAKKYGITWTVARDNVGLAFALGIRTSSTVFVMDESRTSGFRHDGVVSSEVMQEEVEQLVG